MFNLSAKAYPNCVLRMLIPESVLFGNTAVANKSISVSVPSGSVTVNTAEVAEPTVGLGAP